VFFSLFPGMRVARKIGAAERLEKCGDLNGAMRARAEALEILGRPGVDLQMPWCRAGATVALLGYAKTAQELGLQRELRETLVRWRPVYLRWMESPGTPDEANYLKWFEEMVENTRMNS
jgi:hypothetical protein